VKILSSGYLSFSQTSANTLNPFSQLVQNGSICDSHTAYAAGGIARSYAASSWPSGRGAAFVAFATQWP